MKENVWGRGNHQWGKKKMQQLSVGVEARMCWEGTF